MKTNENNLTYR